MTKQQQAIAIARACPSVFQVMDGQVYWKNRIGKPVEVDMFGDLNASHEMEGTIEGDNRIRYYHKLLEAITGRHTGRSTDFEFICATAAQRAEAFLRTLGLWTE